MRCDPVDETLFLWRENCSSFAVEAHESPHGTTSPKHRAELVGEPQRFEDVSIARAACEFSVGRRNQRSHSGSIAGQLRPLVHVIAQELVLHEVRPCIARYFLAVGLGEEEGGGVYGRPPEGVHGNRLAKPRKHRRAQGIGLEPGPAGLDDDRDHVVECGAGLQLSPYYSLSSLSSRPCPPPRTGPAQAARRQSPPLSTRGSCRQSRRFSKRRLPKSRA